MTKYVKNVYDNILDSTDLVYEEEKKLPQIDSADSVEVEKLESQATSDTKTNQIPKNSDVDVDDKTEDIVSDTDEKVIASPLGQSLNYLSNDAYEISKGPVNKNSN